MRIDVLGAVRALHDDGAPVDLGGPRHREVLARLVAAGGRMVATDTLVEDLWAEPPVRAVGALRTFVAALRRAVEPGRPRPAPRRASSSRKAPATRCACRATPWTSTGSRTPWPVPGAHPRR